MKLVVGCPVAERAWVLPAWLESIKSQTFSEPTDVSIVCVATPSHDKTINILAEAGATIIMSPLPTRSYERMIGHQWSYQDHEYERMASLRNDLRHAVLKENADYWFSLDSDILLPNETTIEELVETTQLYEFDAVAPLVNMDWHPDHAPAHNFMRFAGEGGARYEIPGPGPFKTGIIMAAMLLNAKAQIVPWANHKQGEDIGWSVNAQRMGVRVGVDPLVKCVHRMRNHG